MDAETQVFELIAESWGLPFGPAKVALLEEAVRHADAANDTRSPAETAEKSLRDRTNSCAG